MTLIKRFRRRGASIAIETVAADTSDTSLDCENTSVSHGKVSSPRGKTSAVYGKTVSRGKAVS